MDDPGWSLALSLSHGDFIKMDSLYLSFLIILLSLFFFFGRFSCFVSFGRRSSGNRQISTDSDAPAIVVVVVTGKHLGQLVTGRYNNSNSVVQHLTFFRLVLFWRENQNQMICSMISESIKNKLEFDSIDFQIDFSEGSKLFFFGCLC